jgi:AraC-like DNA-binding protein
MINQHILPTLNFVSAFFLLLLTVFVLTCMKKDQMSLLFLAVFFFSRVLILFEMALASWNIPGLNVRIAFTSYPFLFLYLPGLYLYITSHTTNFSFRKIHLLHFLPFLIVFVWFGSVLYFRTVEVKQIRLNTPEFYQSILLNKNWLWLQFILYSSACAWAVYSYSINIKQQVSSFDTARLKWLVFLISAFIVWKGIFVSGYLFSFWTKPLLYDVFRLFIEISFLIYSGALVFIALSNPELFQIVENNKKYKTSSLTRNELQQIIEKLEQVMKTEKLYLDPTISLNQLGKKTRIADHHISQALNGYLNKNFYDYINTFRLEESKRLLINTEKPILHILYDSGFSSKSVFNAVFKKYTGITPGDFRKLNFGKISAN